MIKKICDECGELFYTKNATKTICSRTCAYDRYYRKQKELQKLLKSKPKIFTCPWCGLNSYGRERHPECEAQKAGLLKPTAWNPGKIEPIKRKFNLKDKRTGLMLENSWYGELMLGNQKNPNRELIW